MIEFKREQINSVEYWDSLWEKDRGGNNSRFVGEIKDGTRVIDLGGGWGSLAADIKKARGNCEVYTLDFSRVAHEKGKQKYGHLGIRFLTVSFEQLKDYADYFDYCVAREFLEHVSDLDMVMKKIFGILKPGGTFICSVPHDEEEAVGSPEHLRSFGHESYHYFSRRDVKWIYAEWISFARGDCAWRMMIKMRKPEVK